ncbi:putative harbinger transposase-derived nuclease domain-containing protein [Arabidopsis thaliana]
MGLRDTMNVSVEEMLASFLFIIGQNLRYIQAQDRFKRSRFSIITSFNTILKVLNVFAPSYMAKPTLVVPTKIKDNTRFYPYFKDCVGAIDGTHIPAMITGKETASYRNRKGQLSQNKFFYLVDCGFANCRNCFAPFRSTRYHLQDFRGQGKDPNNQNELFNHRHSSLRNVIERIFGIFKLRFLIFKYAPPFPYKTQAELIFACVVLHNYLRKECRSDVFFLRKMFSKKMALMKAAMTKISV